MCAPLEQPRSTLFDCYGEEKSKILAGVSATEQQQIERYFWRNMHSDRAHTMRRRMEQKSAASALSPLPTSHSSPTGRTAAEELAWLMDYLQSIVQIFQEEKERLQALARQDASAWGKLFSQAAFATYRLLIEMGVTRTHAEEIASDIAHAVCRQVGADLFPCDVPFGAWVHGLLNQQILYQLTYCDELQSPGPANDLHTGMRHEQPGFIAPAAAQSSFGTIDTTFQVAMQPVDSDLLATAIGQLPSLQQRMAIVYLCYYNLSADEIAGRMDKTRDEAEALCRSALRHLRGIMQS